MMFPISSAPRDGSLIQVQDASGMRWWSRWMHDEGRWYPPLRFGSPLELPYASDHPSPEQELSHDEPIAWEPAQ